MDKDEIIKLVEDIKSKHDGVSVIDIIECYGFEIGYTDLKREVYPAYTMNSFKGVPRIVLNNNYNNKSQNILAAHELGHAILHKDNCYNGFGDERDAIKEYEANRFAVALLFNEADINTKFNKMSNYELKYLLDYNIE